MGLKFVGKESVVVDCHAARHNGMRLTLVNNLTMARIDCVDGCDVVEKLRDCASVQEYLDRLRKEGEQEKKKDDGYSVRVCYVNIDDAPAFLNLLDASDHVSEWHAERNDLLSSGEHAIVRINYKSDRQLLFQEGGKVVFRDERGTRDEPKGMRLVGPAVPPPGGERSGVQGLKEKEDA